MNNPFGNKNKIKYENQKFKNFYKLINKKK